MFRPKREFPSGCSGKPAGLNKNRVTTLSPFQNFSAQLREILVNSPGSSFIDNEHFNQLALAFFKLQFTHNPAYRRLCEARRVDADAIQNWSDIPAMPTAGFKELELTVLPPEERARVFYSSGTTAQSRSRHFHNRDSLEIYEASLTAWFREFLPVNPSRAFLSLTPTPELAPNSSLVHMFETLRLQFGAADSAFVGALENDGAWKLDTSKAIAWLREAVAANRPVSVFGTAFNFVHLLDEMVKENLRFPLPVGSCVLETGGYKGRSRVIAKPELHAQISERLGVPANQIASEYGMSELSSQAYDWKVGHTHTNNPERAFSSLSPQRGEGRGEGCEDPGSVKSPNNSKRIFHFPPWARAQIISPETGREVADGETGLIRIFDLANVYSVMAVQTEDLGVRRGDGFELIGRAALAESRGCSLMSI